jgi:hypothetical protein
MDLDVVLCNHAEAAENKLFLTGGGVNMCLVPAMPPHVVTIALGIIVHVPWQLTNQAHNLTVTLRTADGQQVVPWHPEGSPEPPPVQLTAPFNVGRPPFVDVGDDQTLSLAMNFQNLPIREIGVYSFELELDGSEAGHQSFRILTPSPGMGPILMPPQMGTPGQAP